MRHHQHDELIYGKQDGRVKRRLKNESVHIPLSSHTTDHHIIVIIIIYIVRRRKKAPPSTTSCLLVTSHTQALYTGLVLFLLCYYGKYSIRQVYTKEVAVKCAFFYITFKGGRPAHKCDSISQGKAKTDMNA